jgi:phosphoglycerate dehydrogenase-like enzyme
VISRYGVGVDRVDLTACKRKGIVVTNTPGTNTVAVAELAFALMLNVARDIPRLYEGVQRGKWIRNEGMELCGKTLAIIGMGAIGKNLAVRAKAFGMHVVAYDTCFDAEFGKKFGVRALPLDDALLAGDFVSLHVPLSSETRGLIDAARIEHMKDGAVIINTARGGILDEQAAAEAVKSGKLGGLGLDAFEQEPLEGSSLKGLSRVVLTPHTGAHTVEAVAAMGSAAVVNCIDVLEGKDNPYIVNR